MAALILKNAIKLALFKVANIIGKEHIFFLSSKCILRFFLSKRKRGKGTPVFLPKAREGGDELVSVTRF